MKQFFRFPFLLLALLLPALATAQDFEVDGIYYNINGNEAAVTCKGLYYDMFFVGYSGSVVIPATVTYNGTTYSITSIGTNAFYGCTALTSIDIPNSVTSLGYGVFYNCPGLTSIVVESGNPKYDSRNNCNAIIETADNTLIAGCKNTAIPNSVTAIGDYVFSGCTGLMSIDIPNSVTSIGDGAFRGCSGLTSITIPNSVSSIGDWAFQNCSGLTSIVISNSLTAISDDTFGNCTGLTSITIPNSVTAIGEKAFSGCSGLTSVTIPNSVTAVGGKAFYNCSGLTDVYCYFAKPSSVSTGDGVFDLYDWDESGRTLHVLPGTTEQYYYMDWYWYFDQVIEDLIPEPLPGDVNGDREVNIADVNAVVDIIMDGNDDNTAADVNGDGEVNIADINAVIDIILNSTQN